MYRFTTKLRRFSTGAQQKESLLEHLNTHGKGYSIMVGLIAAGLGGLNYVVGIQMEPLKVEIHGIKEGLKELKSQMKESEQRQDKKLNELKAQMKESEQRQDKSMNELKSLLTPLVIQVQVNKERFEDLNKKISS